VTRLSRGYAPISHEELDAPISGNALQLLLRIRRDADQRETDGVIATRHLDALAVAHGMGEEDKRAGPLELTRAKLVRPKRDGYLDVNFLEWCRPADKREARRAQWRTYNKKRPRTVSLPQPLQVRIADCGCILLADAKPIGYRFKLTTLGDVRTPVHCCVEHDKTQWRETDAPNPVLEASARRSRRRRPPRKAN
jgi:hypothetical protein